MHSMERLYAGRWRALWRRSKDCTRNVVEERVKKDYERQRQAANRRQLPNFAVGNYVMVARVRRPGSTPTLVSTWTGL